jgi:hypothetical protein
MKNTKDIKGLIDRYNTDKKKMRRTVIDIVNYTDGSFKIEELVMMPTHYISEIVQSFKDRRDKEKESMDLAKGKNTTTF